MRLRALPWLAVLILAATVVRGEVPETFLDKPVALPHDTGGPTGAPPSYSDRLRDLRQLAGQPVIFPPELETYAAKTKASLHSWFSRTATKDRPTAPLREMISQEASNLGLSWKWDPAKEAIVTDFAWRRPVSHSGRELVEKLAATPPVLEKNRPEDQQSYTDASWQLWMSTFDELISRPENEAMAWKIWLYIQGPEANFCVWGAFPPGNAFASRVFVYPLQTPAGEKYWLVCTYSRSFMFFGGPPSVRMAYFLFTSEGRLEDGGCWGDGRGLGTAPVPVLKDGRLTVTVDQHNTDICNYVFSFAGRPFFQSNEDFNFGMPWLDFSWENKDMTLSFTRHSTTIYELSLYVEKNRLEGVFFKNGKTGSSRDEADSSLALPSHFPE